MNVPLVDLTRSYRAIADRVEAATAEILRSGRYIGGASVKAFEAEFAAAIGSTEGVACNSGTDALYLALRALEIGPGDEVLTAPFTFVATTEVVDLVGAKPIFADIDPESFNLDPDRVAAAITPQTRAILPVDLFGQPADMTRLLAIAREHNLYVIEDCAQATGATWGGQTVGSFGDVGCFSFFPTKNLAACGDGGMLTTDNSDLAARARMLANHGQSDRYLQSAIGINSRLDALQAAILRIKLEYLDEWNQQRRAIAARYDALLAPIPGLKLPREPEGGCGVWNQYTIRVQSGRDARDRLRDRLQANGIGTSIYYPIAVHLQPVYRDRGYQRGDFPQAERATDEVLSLPMFPGLSESEQEQVAYCIKDNL